MDRRRENSWVQHSKITIVLETKWPTNLSAGAYIGSREKPTEVLCGFWVWIVDSRSVGALSELLGNGTNRDPENPQGVKKK